MFKKIVAIAALSGTMALGAVGIAGAATAPSTPATHAAKCAKWEARVPKINAREAKAQTWVTKAQARLATATSAGHVKVAARIQNRINRVQSLEAKGTALINRIDSACGTASAGELTNRRFAAQAGRSASSLRWPAEPSRHGVREHRFPPWRHWRARRSFVRIRRLRGFLVTRRLWHRPCPARAGRVAFRASCATPSRCRDPRVPRGRGGCKCPRRGPGRPA